MSNKKLCIFIIVSAFITYIGISSQSGAPLLCYLIGLLMGLSLALKKIVVASGRGVGPCNDPECEACQELIKKAK